MENFFAIFPHNGKNVSTVWKTPRAAGAGTGGKRAGGEEPHYFLMRTGWRFFIQASWTIIMTWLVDQ